MGAQALDEGKKPSDCIACGACTKVCPQQIDIPGAMAKFAEMIKNDED
jgi:predicted aldo/keto reductase-like oxidoreductase